MEVDYKALYINTKKELDRLKSQIRSGRIECAPDARSEAMLDTHSKVKTGVKLKIVKRLPTQHLPKKTPHFEGNSSDKLKLEFKIYTEKRSKRCSCNLKLDSTVGSMNKHMDNWFSWCGVDVSDPSKKLAHCLYFGSGDYIIRSILEMFLRLNTDNKLPKNCNENIDIMLAKTYDCMLYSSRKFINIKAR